MNSNEDLNIMSNMDGQMMPKWTQMKTWISWAIWMDKWCQNGLKWRLESHEQYGWTNDAKMNSNKLKWRLESPEQYWWKNDAKLNTNEDLYTMSNMDGQMMPKWTQMKTRIPWAIWMDKWCQNELKWRLESHEQYGWTNDSKIYSNEGTNPMSNMDGQMMSKWTQMNSNKDLNIMRNMDGQMMPKWTQMKTWIPWEIWMYKWCQNELKWRLEFHEQYGWTNDAKINSNEDLNTMSNMDWQMMPKWTQMKTRIQWAKWMDKWCLNELHWWLEYHEQYGWTNAAKMNSNEDSNLPSNIDGQMMPKWTQMNSNEDLNLMSNMDGQMMPKWTQMKTWWAWCQNELKWRLESHEQYGWTNDSKMNSNEDLNPMNNTDGQLMPKWTQMEDSNPESNMDGQMMPKWTQMKTWFPWAIWMDKWGQNEHKWRLKYHEQYGWTNDAKMNSNDDLNPMNNMDGQMMPKWTSNEDSNIMSNMDGQLLPKWTQMKTRIPWALWMDKWCKNELKWRLESHEQYG